MNGCCTCIKYLVIIVNFLTAVILFLFSICKRLINIFISVGRIDCCGIGRFGTHSRSRKCIIVFNLRCQPLVLALHSRPHPGALDDPDRIHGLHGGLQRKPVSSRNRGLHFFFFNNYGYLLLFMSRLHFQALVTIRATASSAMPPYQCIMRWMVVLKKE